jgi:HAD superfamily hydrolase (TIGR01509 family)
MAYTIDPRRTRALLFDVDGTLAETEAEGHLPAFNEAFARLGIPWRWSVEDYGDLLRVTGGYERMQAYARRRGDAEWLTPEGLATLREAHQLKNVRYADRLTRGLVVPRLGLAALQRQMAQAGLSWAVVTTTSRDNWQALWQCCLSNALPVAPVLAICGEDVEEKKPHPEAYRLALDRLGLPASACLAVEDSPNGLEAARAADLGCLVVKSVFFQEADFTGALAVTEEHLGLRIADAPDEFPGAAGLQ